MAKQTPEKQWNLLWGRRNRALAKKKQIEQKLDDVKSILRTIDDEAAALMSEAGVRGVKTSFCNISVAVASVPRVEDWAKFYNHIHETKQFDLLERRPARVACRARWDENDQIPGVEQTPLARVRWTRL